MGRITTTQPVRIHPVAEGKTDTQTIKLDSPVHNTEIKQNEGPVTNQPVSVWIGKLSIGGVSTVVLGGLLLFYSWKRVQRRRKRENRR